MRELISTIEAWRRDGVDIGRAVVVRAYGSAPRPEGAVLVLAADGRLAGSVSGGCVEGAVAEAIELARRDGMARVIRYGISADQARDVGLACGGTIDVLVEPRLRDEVVEAAGMPGGAAVAILLPSDAPPAESGPHEPGAGERAVPSVVIRSDGTIAAGTFGDPRADAAIVEAALSALADGRSRVIAVPVGDASRQVFIEAYPARPRLVIVGAVQVAIPLVEIARIMGYETIVIDGRAAFATPERFPDVDRLVLGWPDEVADEIGLGPADAVAVLSHDVKFDEPAIVAAFAHGCRYVGAVGSRKTQADRRARLAAAGVAESDLARLCGPIGLDLGGRSPEETALAIMAEIVAARRGGTARPLRVVAVEKVREAGS
jgi:xanthine dehydrogenase accessory factor